jgi:post-segregation antitoxin (ccd killing protein)
MNGSRAGSTKLSGKLRGPLKQAVDERWLIENRQAIDHYNGRVERDGVFSDEIRRF